MPSIGSIIVEMSCKCESALVSYYCSPAIQTSPADFKRGRQYAGMHKQIVPISSIGHHFTGSAVRRKPIKRSWRQETVVPNVIALSPSTENPKRRRKQIVRRQQNKKTKQRSASYKNKSPKMKFPKPVRKQTKQKHNRKHNQRGSTKRKPAALKRKVGRHRKGENF